MNAILRLARLGIIAAFFGALLVSAGAAPKRLLIVGQGPDGHPPTTHEFMPGARVLAELLKPYPDIQATVANADEPWASGPALIDQADGIVMFVTQGARWMQTDPQRHAALKRLAARGGAIIALHWSVGAKEAQYIQGQLDLLGGTRGGEHRKYQVLTAELKRVDPKHPILTCVPDFKVHDEFYYALDRVPGIQPLFTANIDGKDEMVAWSWDRADGGRSFGFVALHFHANWQLPEYRRFIVQGVLWSLKLPVPKDGVNVDIDSKALELDGVLPPMPTAKKAKASKKAAASKPVFLYCRYFNAVGETRYLPNGTYSDVLGRLGQEFELRISSESLSPKSLKGVNVVLISNPSEKAVGKNPPPPHVTSADIETLTRFVETGGGLIVMGNQENHNLEIEDLNKLLERFGLQFANLYTDVKQIAVPKETPVIGGLNWGYYTGNLVTIAANHPAKPRALVTNNPSQKPLNGTRNQPGALLAVSEPGKGRVIVATDAGWIGNDVLSNKGIGGIAVAQQDNWEIFRRLAHWAAGSPTATR
ncbi:MAG: ThuA domain-containing protein [Verrucomicrobiota bacterium]